VENVTGDDNEKHQYFDVKISTKAVILVNMNVSILDNELDYSKLFPKSFRFQAVVTNTNELELTILFLHYKAISYQWISFWTGKSEC
jgi:hypothetical protein